MGETALCIHGHFYQPAREDPFSGLVPREVGAAPYHDFNEKITAECYRPNADEGNFARLSFDLGPTIASWLAEHAPDVLARITADAAEHRRVHGAANALAQPYNHSILPLANAHERRVQIAWGLADYTLRFGHAAEGMWLPETAVDLTTLRALADAGLRYTILAPWQAAAPVDPTEPYWIDLADGRQFAVFFYHEGLSGGVSFEDNLTVNADAFRAAALRQALNPEKQASGEPQLILVATDGELYGHHKALRDKFLSYLLGTSAPAGGLAVTSLGAYLQRHPPRRTIALAPRTAWSCRHDLNRWRAGCPCTPGDSAWKLALRGALDRLAGSLDALFAQAAGAALPDPWAALDGYLGVRLGAQPFAALLRAQAPLDDAAVDALRPWFELQYYRQLMLTSCGWFFEDLDRIEPRNNIAYAARALSFLPPLPRRSLEAALRRDLAKARSSRTGRTGADLYRAALATTAAVVPTAPASGGTGIPAALQAAGASGLSSQRGTAAALPERT